MDKLTDKRIIADLKSANEHLTSELFDVNQRLKESEAFKSHFISNITNEILNPFSSILALSENIRNLGQTDMEQAKKMANLIHQETFQLDFQLKNIFAAAMTEAGRDDLMPVRVNLIGLVKQAILFFRTETEHKQLKLDLEIGDHSQEKLNSFLTDERKLELITKNLLSNAIKFSHQKGQIKISIELKDNKFSMGIRDFGKGIPEDEFRVIFDRFKQLDQSTDSFNTGQGLGLSIVKAYLLELEGKIVLENLEGGGLKVWIEIPELNLAGEYDDLGEFLFNDEEKF